MAPRAVWISTSPFRRNDHLGGITAKVLDQGERAVQGAAL
jgi:hypothetical protein